LAHTRQAFMKDTALKRAGFRRNGSRTGNCQPRDLKLTLNENNRSSYSWQVRLDTDIAICQARICCVATLGQC